MNSVFPMRTGRRRQRSVAQKHHQNHVDWKRTWLYQTFCVL